MLLLAADNVERETMLAVACLVLLRSQSGKSHCRTYRSGLSKLESIVAIDGDQAESLIPKIRRVIESYGFRQYVGTAARGLALTLIRSCRPH